MVANTWKSVVESGICLRYHIVKNLRPSLKCHAKSQMESITFFDFQELALYEHLTVKEIIQYYGKLYGLSDEDVDVRWRVLSKLLELSSKRSKQISNIR